MASSYPTSLDSFTDPTSGSSLASPSHSGQHIDLNDAVEKLEAKLGIGSSPASSATNGAVLVANGSGTTTYSSTGYGVYTAYTPTFSGFTLGNGTLTVRYTQMNKYVHVYGVVTLGSTSVMTGPLDVSLPATAVGGVLTVGGNCQFYNNSLLYFGQLIHITTTSIRLVATNASGTYAYNADIGAAVPFSWANTHSFRWNHVYEAA